MITPTRTLVVCLIMMLLTPGASALMVGVDTGTMNVSTYTLNFSGVAIPMEYSVSGDVPWNDVGALTIQTVITVVNNQVTSITHNVEYRSASQISVLVNGMTTVCQGEWIVPVYHSPVFSCKYGSVVVDALELISFENHGSEVTIHGGECYALVALSGTQHWTGNSGTAETYQGFGVCG
jgi:hypothetical protein